MRQTIRKFLHDIISELTGVQGNSVIWANQGQPKKITPLITLRLYGENGEAMAEHLKTSDAGILDLRTPSQFILEVQYYGQKSEYPCDILAELVRNFERPTIVDRFMGNGVAFLYADDVQDLTNLLGNQQQYEPRAAVDLHLRYTAQVLDDVGIINQVDIHGETPQSMDWSVSNNL